MSQENSTQHGVGWPWQQPEGSQRVKAAGIIRDARHQPREALEANLVKRYVTAMETGSKFPPVTLARIKGKEGLHLLCGWHRYEAAAFKLGMKHVQATVINV